MNLERHLKALGFNNEKLHYQFHSDKIHYYIVYHDTDSHGFHIWSIEDMRHLSTSFRGRILNGSEFDMILMRVIEDYALTQEEINLLKITNNV